MSNDSKNDSALDINAPDMNSSVKCIDWPHCATREIDTAGWLFDDEQEKPSNLTVLPSLAVIVFLVLVFLKVYKWYKDNAKRKARGDVEFGDDSEVNYGIIKEGDKEFCQVEIRSDTTSVYDTVNSFRLFTNGHATCVNAAPTYHDTVSSYKSLLIQRGDASHYDSVKSYKAFLKQVTQNKNLDVEVKLLENYPMKCKSTEHCVVVEEEFGASQNAKSRLFPCNTKACADGKKKFRYRRASGEPLGPMRKRSASNPVYNSSHTGATSLPSIHYSVSSDDSNEEDTLSAFRNERKKAHEDRCKKMSRSCSGGKLSKASKTVEEEDEAAANPKRKRHYSADGCSRLGKGFGNVHFKISRAFQHELNNLRESISETDPKLEEHVLLVSQEESSSENPDSSPSSHNSSVSSDAIESDSDDDTQQVTQISAMSDCTAFNSNELASSMEQLSTHSACSDGFNSMDVFCSLKDTMPCSCEKSNTVSTNEIEPHENNYTSNFHSENSTQDDVSHTYQKGPQICSDQQTPHSESNSAANDITNPAVHNISPSVNCWSFNHIIPSSNAYHKPITAAAVAAAAIHEVDDSEDTDNSMASNPRRVKRFHVTSVQKDDISSVKLDSRQSSSGGSLFESLNF